MRKDDEEVKHVCKFCDKSFPSGRQLCGHMRSHQNHSNYVDADRIGNKKKKRRRMRKRKSLELGGNSGGEEGLRSGGIRTAFVLGENPRKSWRLVDESSKEVWLGRDKSCRECGRGFGSWKALLGHMKRHALEDRDSRTGNDQGAVVEGREDDSQLDDEDKEEVAVPSWRRRSERRKRYMVAAASSSSVSLVSNINDVNDNGNHRVGSSVPEIDQEQEEVAMCLMLLSRDVGHRKAMDSVMDESSKRSSLDAKRGGGIIGNSGLDNLEAENENQFQSQVDLPEFGSMKDSISAQGSQMATMEAKASKIIDRKRSLSSDMNDSELGMKIQKEFADDEFGFGLLSGVKSDKRGRFECTTCNKAFQSYQALGGHKASHSRIKDCFRGNIIGKAEISHPAKGQKMIEKTVNMFVGKKHECLVCLKVFPSGQALGGHKRSHMQPGGVAEGASVVEPVATARDVLDLNLPAQIEDEGSSHVTVNSWCSQRHEEAFTRF